MQVEKKYEFVLEDYGTLSITEPQALELRDELTALLVDTGK